ncbi:MAG: hypothetical protein RSB82_04415 [Victivallaceae bacterium]
MTYFSNIDGSTPFPGQAGDDLVIREETTSERPSVVEKTQRLKAVGITLLIIGLLLIVTGVVGAAVLSQPLFFLSLATGLVLTVVAGVLLAKTKRYRTQLGEEVSVIVPEPGSQSILGRLPEEVSVILPRPEPQSVPIQPDPEVPAISTDPRLHMEQPKAEAPVRYRPGLRRTLSQEKFFHSFFAAPVRSDREPPDHTFKDNFNYKYLKNSLRQCLPQVVTDATDYDAGRLVQRMVFSNGNGLYLSCSQGDIGRLAYNPFQERPPITAIVYEAYSKKFYTPDNVSLDTSQALKNSLLMKPGECCKADWLPSKSTMSAFHWNFFYKFRGEEVSYVNNKPQKGYEVMKIGFKNLFASCIDSGISILQMPLLCCEKFDFYMGQNRRWVKAVGAALLEVLGEISERVDSEHPFCVNIVGKDSVPFYMLLADIERRGFLTDFE